MLTVSAYPRSTIKDRKGRLHKNCMLDNSKTTTNVWSRLSILLYRCLWIKLCICCSQKTLMSVSPQDAQTLWS